jgi:integrase
MAKTTSLDFDDARKYALNLFKYYENETDTRLINSNRMFALALLIGLDTGARITDILNMKFSDVYEMEDYYNVWKIKYKVHKSSKDTEWIISTKTQGKITETQEWLKKKFYSKTVAPDLIFINPETGKSYTREWARKRVIRANKLQPMKRGNGALGFHSVRKTAANELYKRCKDLRVVKDQLMHSKLTTTNLYLGLDKKTSMEKAMRAMGYVS